MQRNFRKMIRSRNAKIFTHIDLSGDGELGDRPPESDVISVFLNLDVNASVSAFLAPCGFTNALDLGVAVPFIVTELRGDAKATITGRRP
jgi:hypothetical protein